MQEDVEKGPGSLDGLTTEEVAASRSQHGSNEVKAQQTPEWKKVGQSSGGGNIAKYYSDHLS